MRLIDIEHNREVRIVDIQGGRGVTRKLQQLSLMPGDIVVVKKRAPLQGPLLVEAHGRSVALGRGVAAKVEVERV